LAADLVHPFVLGIGAIIDAGADSPEAKLDRRPNPSRANAVPLDLDRFLPASLEPPDRLPERDAGRAVDP